MNEKIMSVDSVNPQNHQSFALNSIKVFLKLLIAILALTLLNGLFVFDTDSLSLTLFLCIIIASFLYVFVTQDTVNMVAGILIWLLTVMFFYMAWRHNGLFATSMIALPCMIIIAIAFSRRVVYVPLVLFIIIALLFFSYCYQTGLLVPPQITNQYAFYGKAIDVILIIMAMFIFMEMLIRNVRMRLQKLSTDNENLTTQLREVNKIMDYDMLTKLPNERICKKQLAGYIDSSKTEGNLVGYLSLNIQNLKAINTSIGHDAVDEILIQFANRIATLESNSVSFYRIQGHEFIALKYAPDHHDISAFAEQIIQATKAPFNTINYELEVSVSVGIAVAPFDGSTIEELRKKSHLALQYKQESLEQAFHFFDLQMVDVNKDKVHLLADLKNAIDNEEFELYFQPKVDLLSLQVIGAEALIRWHRAGYGMVPPDVFIPLAEESGLITKISQWVAKQAIKACKSWHNLGLQHITVAINLSEVDFRRGNLPQKLLNYLSDVQLAPHYLELELTESMIIDDVSHVQRQIQQLHAKGVSLAIDDFGTGYSNLGYLSKFNVSSLKIDQSFIRNLDESEHDYHIVKAIIQMGLSLGIAIVAEGIENDVVAQKLKKLNCQFGQGYLWSKPLNNDEFIAFLQQKSSV